MDEGVKNKLILILGVLVVIFLLTSVVSCANSHRQRLGRSKEIVIRLDLEEKLNSLEREKEAALQKLNTLNSVLEAEKAALQTAEKALLQEQLVGQNLKAELEKVSRLKETLLEEDLEETLVEKEKNKK